MNTRVLQVHGFLVATVLCVAGSLFLTPYVTSPEDGLQTPLAEKINPNSASVGSLVRLPQIGLARARAIVAYRDSVWDDESQREVFGCPADLQCISGIGPKTVAGIADCLEFGLSGLVDGLNEASGSPSAP